jgi:L-lactate dehydrogenase complex protein LldE
MKVQLFAPCFVDQLQPRVGLATVALLEGLGHEVEFPGDQTCCGQPFLNCGDRDGARALARRLPRVFAGDGPVVCPSASCTAMVRHHLVGLVEDEAEARALAARTFELCEFLVHHGDAERLTGRFPHRVGLHTGCHGLRELGLGGATEVPGAHPSLVAGLLGRLEGLELVEPERPDECCGFGGTFAVTEPEVSCAMGRDRLLDHGRAGAEVIVTTDGSCQLHLEGLRGRGAAGPPLMHVAEVLAGEPMP